MFNRCAIAAALAFALAACGGGGSKTAKPGDDNNINRPPPQKITTADGNELKVGGASTNWYVVNGQFVRKPGTAGVRWVTITEYPVFKWLPQKYTPGAPQILQGEEWTEASTFYWGYWSDNDARSYFGGYRYQPGTTKRIGRFGVILENDEITPFAAGVKPLTDFAGNSYSLGTAQYDGTLVGLTVNEKRPVAGHVTMEFDLSPTDITGTFELSNLSRFERDGSLSEFLGGTLRQSIAVNGNSFTTTGGDPGTVTGVFAGEGHEAAAGTFQHSAFTGAFSAAEAAPALQGPGGGGSAGVAPLPPG